MSLARKCTLAICAGVLALLTAPPTGPAYAGGSDSPTPYTVTASGVTLPSGVTFPANGHVNYTATKLDGTGQQSFGVHFDPNNQQPGGRFIGQSFFGFTDYPATADYGAITRSAASAFPDGYCITWVQVSMYNEHFGEGGQKPVCTSTPPPTPPVTPPVPPTPPGTPPVPLVLHHHHAKPQAYHYDKCGTASDVYGVKKAEGVVYMHHGKVLPVGVWLKTHGKHRVVIKAYTTWDHRRLRKWVFHFTDTSCPAIHHLPHMGL